MIRKKYPFIAWKGLALWCVPLDSHDFCWWFPISKHVLCSLWWSNFHVHIFSKRPNLKDGVKLELMPMDGNFQTIRGRQIFGRVTFKGWTGKLRGCMGNILLSFHGNLYHTYSIHNHDVMWLCAAQNLISKPFSHVCTTFGKEPGTLNCSYWSNHFINLQP